MKPSSFCTICTSPCAFELKGLLLSLSVYHTDETIYIMSDSKTKKSIEEMTPQPRLNIKWFIELDEYDGMNRMIMVDKGLWSKFQMSKPNIIKRALEYEKDTLFLDSDIIILDELNDIDDTKELGVSPQFIKQVNIDETGYYNGGCLWTRSKELPDDWIKFTETSRYFDQASIEDLVKKYLYFEFGDNYNLQCWRLYLSPEGSQKISSYLSSDKDIVMYKDKPLKFIHTHFLDPRFNDFNNLLLNHINNAKLYKILLIIFRVIKDKWIIKIPKQPIQGMGYHKNDSFRELPLLMKKYNKDVDIELVNDSIHCWIYPNILLYDRPTLEWCSNEILDSSLFLLGNGDINKEGEELNRHLKHVKSWIFWPRRPMIVEKILNNKGILNYEERDTESIFIGNFENPVQEKYRNINDNWENVLSEYHCTKGDKHKFTNEEYLMKLRSSKYGLCLRGYGSKCHREVELMAFGTIPVITLEVSIESYMEPLIENIHYIRVNNTDEFKQKISEMDENKWNEMSKGCYEWYQRNVYSKNCWNNMIENILYLKD
tara:strand:- start:214 stop:1842 length:1629 start_codon:yes stop_codon:yes gene_type:complete